MFQAVFHKNQFLTFESKIQENALNENGTLRTQATVLQSTNSLMVNYWSYGVYATCGIFIMET